MIKLFTKALVLSLILIGTHAVAGTAGLAGNWMGPNGGTLNIGADGQGTVKSGACELKLGERDL